MIGMGAKAPPPKREGEMEITVTLQVYEERPVQLASGELAYKVRHAFWITFPDGTHSWSHNRANVRALAREYCRSYKKTFPIHWDGSCGTYDP